MPTPVGRDEHRHTTHAAAEEAIERLPWSRNARRPRARVDLDHVLGHRRGRRSGNCLLNLCLDNIQVLRGRQVVPVGRAVGPGGAEVRDRDDAAKLLSGLFCLRDSRIVLSVR